MEIHENTNSGNLLHSFGSYFEATSIYRAASKEHTASAHRKHLTTKTN